MDLGKGCECTKGWSLHSSSVDSIITVVEQSCMFSLLTTMLYVCMCMYVHTVCAKYILTM